MTTSLLRTAVTNRRGPVRRWDAGRIARVTFMTFVALVFLYPLVGFFTVALRSDGFGVYRMDDGTDWVYEPGAFGGVGTVLGLELPCLTPETMMLEHATGYELDDVHRADVAALAKAFGLAVPHDSLDTRPSS